MAVLAVVADAWLWRTKRDLDNIRRELGNKKTEQTNRTNNFREKYKPLVYTPLCDDETHRFVLEPNPDKVDCTQKKSGKREIIASAKWSDLQMCRKSIPFCRGDSDALADDFWKGKGVQQTLNDCKDHMKVWSCFENSKNKPERRQPDWLVSLSVATDLVGQMADKAASSVRELEKLKSEIDSLEKDRDQKEKEYAQLKFPTPIGSFELHPAIGLFLLATSVPLCLLAFRSRVNRAKSIAASLVSVARSENQPIGTLPPPPFWIYPLESEIANAVSPKGQPARCILGAVVFNWVWWVLGVLILIECFRLDVQSELWFLTEYILLVPMALLVAAGALLSWQTLRMPLRLILGRLTDFVRETGATDEQRRLILVGASLAMVSVMVGRFLLRSRPSTVFQVDLGGKDDLVGNRRSSVLHHALACVGHLPSKWNRDQGVSRTASYRLHRGYESRILENAARHSKDEDAEGFLMNAIKFSPLALHLYDRLIRVWGRLKEYEKMEPLINNALKRIEVMRQKEHRETQLNQLSRAEKEFRLRQKAIRSRAESSQEA